ncbi:hypothetical protein KCA24_32620, partial [Escherichia coli]|nr:hypothetical protein [Escherichia coli]
MNGHGHNNGQGSAATTWNAVFERAMTLASPPPRPKEQAVQPPPRTNPHPTPPPPAPPPPG